MTQSPDPFLAWCSQAIHLLTTRQIAHLAHQPQDIAACAASLSVLTSTATASIIHRVDKIKEKNIVPVKISLKLPPLVELVNICGEKRYLLTCQHCWTSWSSLGPPWPKRCPQKKLRCRFWWEAEGAAPEDTARNGALCGTP